MARDDRRVERGEIGAVFLIREKRTAKGWSVSQLCRNVDISERALYRYESGKRLPDFNTVLRIAHALGCESITELYEVKATSAGDMEPC
ncbi:helix-turn-helix transcriptional regulator [Salmonella enterica]|nr:helix-turn-helix transcriptional regulator [Salmonella enterica]